MTPEKILEITRAAIEMDRECSDEPFAWAVFDGEGGWDLFQYAMNEDLQKEFLEGNPDPMYRDWVKPLYTRPAPARKPLSDDEIEKEFDRRCELDCCPDFSEAVRWAEKMHGIGETE